MKNKSAYQLFSELSKKPEKWKHIEELAVYKEYPKNYVLCKAGSYPKNYFFIKKGVVRKYYTDNKGKEFNKLLFTDNHIATSLTAITTNTVSNLTIESLTPVSLYEIPYEKLMSLIKNDLELLNLYAEMLHLFFRDLESSEIEKVTMEATDRYLAFLKRFPDLENKIPLFHIASYLGITPIQLSRIRKTLKEKK